MDTKRWHGPRRVLNGMMPGSVEEIGKIMPKSRIPVKVLLVVAGQRGRGGDVDPFAIGGHNRDLRHL